MTDTDWLALADFLDKAFSDLRAAADGLRQYAALTAATTGDPTSVYYEVEQLRARLSALTAAVRHYVGLYHQSTTPQLLLEGLERALDAAAVKPPDSAPPPTDRWAGEHNRPDGSPCGYLLVTGAPACLKCGTPAPPPSECPVCLSDDPTERYVVADGDDETRCYHPWHQLKEDNEEKLNPPPGYGMLLLTTKER